MASFNSGNMMTKSDEIGARRPDGLCDGCGAVLVDRETHAPAGPFIGSIIGLDQSETMADGTLISWHPASCAKPSCLAAILADPKWSRTDWPAKRREHEAREERARRHTAEYDAETAKRRPAIDAANEMRAAAQARLYAVLGLPPAEPVTIGKGDNAFSYTPALDWTAVVDRCRARLPADLAEAIDAVFAADRARNDAAGMPIGPFEPPLAEALSRP